MLTALYAASGGVFNGFCGEAASESSSLVYKAAHDIPPSTIDIQAVLPSNTRTARMISFPTLNSRLHLFFSLQHLPSL